MTARPFLLLVHGWGFDAGMWRELRAVLADFETEAVDLGYFGRPRRPALAAGRGAIAVGHSLGFMWLLRERPADWRGLVSVAGMPRFTKAADFPFGVAPRLLSATRNRFAADPAGTLADFYAACGCGAPQVPGPRDDARLAEGLGWLAEWDLSRELDAERAPVLALYAADDPVLPAALSESVFAARPGTTCRRRPDGGHALPVTRARWCADEIRAFAAGLA